MGVLISDFPFPVQLYPLVVDVPFLEEPGERLVQTVVEVFMYAGGVFPGQAELLANEHAVATNDDPGTGDDGGREAFVMAVADADHAAVLPVALRCQFDGAEVPVVVMGDGMGGLLDLEAVSLDPLLDLVVKPVMGDRRPAEGRLWSLYQLQLCPVDYIRADAVCIDGYHL